MSKKLILIKLQFPKNTIPFVFVSLGMMVIHMMFMSNLLPWIDEVMYTDTPLHFVSGDGWITHAWPTNAGRKPFSLVSPLYQFLLTGWMWLFGTSLWASRSFNLLIMVLIGICTLRFTERVGLSIGKGGAIVFALLLWLTPAMSFMCRNGRCDLLGALFSINLFIQVIDYLYGRIKKKWLIMAFSALAIMTSLPAAIFVTLVLFLGIVYLKGQRKRILWSIILTFIGYIIGFVLTAIFFVYNGALLAFLENTFAFSGTLKSFAAIVFPYVGPVLGLDTDYYMGKFMHESTVPVISFGDRFLELLHNPSYMFILLACIAIIVFRYKKIAQTPNKKVIYGLLLLGILIPLLMLMIGRFVAYYYWMALLPLFLCLCALFTLDEGRINKCVVTAVLVVLGLLGGMAITNNSHYAEMRTFISESTFLKNKVIASPFAPFYEIEQKSNNVYYPEVMSAENLPDHFDYIIVPNCNTVAEKKIEQLLDKIKAEKSNEVRLVATCQEPYLEIYEVLSRP